MTGVFTFLSEYHPQKSTIAEPINPPGVARIRVCFDLAETHISEKQRQNTVHVRVSEAFNNDVTDYAEGVNFH